jgi:hypothetical protein
MGCTYSAALVELRTLNFFFVISGWFKTAFASQSRPQK